MTLKAAINEMLKVMPYKRLKNMKTLLVEDDPWIRDSMRLLFETEECPMVALETAEEGLDILLQGESFDLFIADFRLPGMDGVTFLKRIIPVHPKAIKILCTAYPNDAMAAGAGTMKIDAVLHKPFTTDQFEEVLSNVMARC